MYFSPSGGIMDILSGIYWLINDQRQLFGKFTCNRLVYMYVHIQQKCHPRQLWSIWVSMSISFTAWERIDFYLNQWGEENLHICIWTRRYPGYCKTAVVRFRYCVIPLPSILLLLSYRYYHWTVLAILWLHLCVMYSFAMKKACERNGVCMYGERHSLPLFHKGRMEVGIWNHNRLSYINVIFASKPHCHNMTFEIL